MLKCYMNCADVICAAIKPFSILNLCVFCNMYLMKVCAMQNNAIASNIIYLAHLKIKVAAKLKRVRKRILHFASTKSAFCISYSYFKLKFFI